MTVTSYNPTVAQNDASPCIAAGGHDICKLAKEGKRVIAISRDLRQHFLPKAGKYYKYPVQVYIESDNPSIHGCAWVYDVLSSHKFKGTKREKAITNQIDLFFLNRKDNQGGKAQISNKLENCK